MHKGGDLDCNGSLFTRELKILVDYSDTAITNIIIIMIFNDTCRTVAHYEKFSATR